MSPIVDTQRTLRYNTLMNNYFCQTVTVTPKDDLAQTVKNAKPYTRILLQEGVFFCKLEIDAEGLTLEGENPAKTIICWNDYAKKNDEKGVELNTFRTYTVAVCADNVTLRNLTIRNGAGNSPENGQEVALTVYGKEFTAENCILDSEQDTLFCGPLPRDLITRYDGFLKDKLRRDITSRQIYRNCVVRGTVDFVFGCGDCLFERCEFVSLNDGRTGFVAAPAHSKEQNVGFVFENCFFSGQRPESVFLARPWRDFGKASFVDCLYGKHVDKRGFDKWNDTDRDKTARFAENVEIAGRVSWSRTLTQEEVYALTEYFKN